MNFCGKGPLFLERVTYAGLHVRIIPYSCTLYFVYHNTSGRDACLTWLDSLYLLGDASSVLSERATGVQPIGQKGVEERKGGEKIVEVQVIMAAHQSS